MQFDFNLQPGQSQHIDVTGSFVKYKNGTGTIRVRLNGGGYIDLLPGQGVNNVQFNSIDVQDRTGAANAGTILAGMYDFRDDRITGTVDVVDGGKARVNAGLAFMGSAGQWGNAGEMGYIQLWNPASNTRNLILENLVLACSTAGQVNFGPSNVALPNVFVNPPLSKRFMAAQAATVAQIRTNSSSADLLGNSFANLLIAANQATQYQFKEPVVITPGNGLLANASTAAAKLILTFEYFEEPV